MKQTKEVAKGMAIGIANVIPGVSGGTIAVIVGAYETIIEAIAMFTKRPIWALRSIWKYLVGIMLGLAFAVFVISFLYEKAPIMTAFLFIGLIVGSIPMLARPVKFENLTSKEWLIFSAMILLVASIPFINSEQVVLLLLSPNNLIIMFLLGLVAATTMIIPGISGSMILMVFGYYEVILDVVKHFYVWQNILLIGAFGFGGLVGIIVFARFIRYLLARKPTLALSAILGLVVASPIPIISYLNFTGIGQIELIVALICLFGGFIFAYRMTMLKVKE